MYFCWIHSYIQIENQFMPEKRWRYPNVYRLHPSSRYPEVAIEGWWPALTLPTVHLVQDVYFLNIECYENICFPFPVENFKPTMEELFFRFSHLSEQIFCNLTNETLVKLKEVSRPWNEYTADQKFLEIRIIEATVQDFHKLDNVWKTSTHYSITFVFFKTINTLV